MLIGVCFPIGDSVVSHHASGGTGCYHQVHARTCKDSGEERGVDPRGYSSVLHQCGEGGKGASFYSFLDVCVCVVSTSCIIKKQFLNVRLKHHLMAIPCQYTSGKTLLNQG